MGCVDHGKTGDKQGYGTAWHEGLCRGMHRIAYAKHYGIPMKDLDGVVIMHTCDNPRCINVAHLKAGTQADNVKDMDDKGRRVVVPRVCTLPECTIKAIRSEYVPHCRKHGGGALAKKYGVSRTLINRVVNGG